MNRIYCAIGKIVEVTQNIEVDIEEICKYSEIVKEFSRHQNMTLADFNQAEDDANYLKQKMETMTFGQKISIVQDSKSLRYDEISELKSLLEKRNYFTHEYFKVTNFQDNMREDYILDEFNALKDYLSALKKMLNKLEMIKRSQIERLEYLKRQNRI